MQILISNVAEVPNKYTRLLKWKLYNLAEKFKNLLYIEAFINKEGTSPAEYITKLRLGIPGHDIIISMKSSQIGKCIHQITNKAHVQLAHAKEIMLSY